jgi:hypothetical protein
VKQLYQNILSLVFINIFIVGAGLTFSPVLGVNMGIHDILLLAFGYTVIAVITLFIFIRGQSRKADSQTMHTLFSLSLKFLLELLLALFWFIVAKKTSHASVLIFFILYLAFTLFTIFVILKALKNKSLQN